MQQNQSDEFFLRNLQVCTSDGSVNQIWFFGSGKLGWMKIWLKKSSWFCHFFKSGVHHQRCCKTLKNRHKWPKNWGQMENYQKPISRLGSQKSKSVSITHHYCTSLLENVTQNWLNVILQFFSFTLQATYLTAPV